MKLIFIFFTAVSVSWASHAEQYFKPEEVKEMMKSSPEAKAADTAAEAVAKGNSEIKNSLYGIADGIMPWLIEQAGGDEAKMKKLLSEAQTDPQAFIKRLPAHIQAQVAGVVHKLEPAKTPANPAP
jgi:hypothetical protein